MKGKRWELPQKFRTIYWQNFALTASIVMLTLALLGASFGVLDLLGSVCILATVVLLAQR